MSAHEEGLATANPFSERVDVADLRPNTFTSPNSFIEGTVALLWPYSSSHSILSLLVVEKDVRRRRANGQVKVSFHGHCARDVARTRIGIGDDVKLSLNNVSWTHTGEEIATPGKKVAYDLEYRIALAIEIRHGDESVFRLNIAGQIPSPISSVSSPSRAELNASTSSRTALAAAYKPINYSTPARVLSATFIDASLDPFAEDDGYIFGRGRKRTKFARHSGAWKLWDDDDSNDTGIANSPDANGMISHSGLRTHSVDEQEVVSEVTTDFAPETNDFQDSTGAIKSPAHRGVLPIEHPIPSPEMQKDSVVEDLDTLHENEPLRPHDQHSDDIVPEDPSTTALLHEMQSAESSPLAHVSSPSTHVAAMPELLPELLPVPKVLPPYPESLVADRRFSEVLAGSLIPETEPEPREVRVMVDDNGDDQSDYTGEIGSRATPLEIISDDEVDDSENDFKLQQPVLQYEDPLSPAIVDSLVHSEDADIGDDMLGLVAPVVPVLGHVQMIAEIETPNATILGDPMLDEAVDLDALQQQIDDQVGLYPKLAPLDTGIEDDDLYGSPAVTNTQMNATDIEDADAPAITGGLDLRFSHVAPDNAAVDETYEASQNQILDDHAQDDLHSVFTSQPFSGVRDFNSRISEHEVEQKEGLLVAQSNEPSVVESCESTEVVLLPSSDDTSELEQRQLIARVSSSAPSTTYDGTQESDEESIAPGMSIIGEREEPQLEPHGDVDDASEAEEQQASNFTGITNSADAVLNVDTIAPRTILSVEGQLTYEHLTPPATQQHYSEFLQPITQEPAYAQAVPLTPEPTQKYRSSKILDSAVDQAQVEPAVGEEYRLPTMLRRDTQSPPRQPPVRLYSDTSPSNPASNSNFTPRDDPDIEQSSPVIPSEPLSAEEEASQALVSSQNAIEAIENLQEQSLPHVLRGTTTSHSYYPRLGSIDEHFNHLVDVFAVVSSSTPAQKAKSGPKDHFTTLQLVDASCEPNSPVIAQLFRPRKSALPTAKRGDVILFRDLKVQTQDRKPMLLSTESSAWMIFETRSDSANSPNKGPPVEFGQEEEQMCEGMRKWWAANSINYQTDECADIDRETRSASPMVTRSQRKKSQGATQSKSIDLGSPSDHANRQSEAIYITPATNSAASEQQTEAEGPVVSHTNRRTRLRPRHRSQRSESTVLGTEDSQMSPSNYREGSLVHELRDGLTYVDE